MRLCITEGEHTNEQHYREFLFEKYIVSVYPISKTKPHMRKRDDFCKMWELSKNKKVKQNGK